MGALVGCDWDFGFYCELNGKRRGSEQRVIGSHFHFGGCTLAAGRVVERREERSHKASLEAVAVNPAKDVGSQEVVGGQILNIVGERACRISRQVAKTRVRGDVKVFGPSNWKKATAIC